MRRFLYACFIPLAHGWTFLYTNSSSQVTILEETGTRNCTKINQAGDKLFTWDPEKSNLCISLYYDSECKSRGGISCPYWKKTASTDFNAIEVFTDNEAVSASISTKTVTPEPTSSATTESSSSTTTTATAAATTSAAPTTSAAAENNGSGSSSGLSGGAIAGIVIGAIAGVSIIAALFFFFGRRNRKNAAAANGSTDTPDQGPYARQASVPGTATSYVATSPSTGLPAYQDQVGVSSGGHPGSGSQMSELSSQARPAELVSSPLSELDAGQDQKSYFHRPMN